MDPTHHQQIRTWSVVLSASIVLAGSAFAQDPARTIVLIGATIIDVSHGGTTTHDIHDAAVVLRGSQIIAADSRANVPIPADADVVDVAGKFIVPGLVDGFTGMQSQAEANAHLHAGVTTIAASGDDRRGTLYLAADPSPHVYAIDSVGSTDDWSLLRNDPSWRELLADGSAPHELTQQQTQAQLLEVARRHIRAVWIGHAITEGNTRFILAEAHRLGLVTYGEFVATPYQAGLAGGVTTLLHMTRFELGILAPNPALSADPEGAAADLAYAAVDRIDPGSADVDRYGEEIHRAHVTLMPTFSLFYAAMPEHRNLWLEPGAALFDASRMVGTTDPASGDFTKIGPQQRASFERMALHTFEIDRALIARGAVVMAASGSTWQGTLPGISLHTELELLVRAGLTPRAALAAATGNYAEQFGWSELGKIEAGRRADLVVLNHDPTTNIRFSNDIDQIYLAGQRVDRGALLKP